MSAETLRQVFVRAPVGSCAVSALATLLSLAHDMDFEATRALGRLLAHELDYDSDSIGFLRAKSYSELLAADDVPPVLRIYLLALTPRNFFKNIETCAQLASVVQSEGDLGPFRRLVLRDAPVQHEVLKAYVLSAFANFYHFYSTMSMSVSQGGLLRILDQILSNCRIVPGNNATREFEFGKDLLVSMTTGGLFSVIYHEFGHHLFEALGTGNLTGANDTPFDTLISEVANALPNLLESAVRLVGTPLHRDDGRSFKASTGLTILCTYAESDRGSYIHMSLMQQAGPIELEQAAQLAYVILGVLEVNTGLAAVAYSPRGVFHFGFSGNGPPVDQVRHHAQTLIPGEWSHDLAGRSTQWLDALAQAGRAGKSESDVPAALGVVNRTTRFYGLNPQFAAVERALCGQNDLREATAEALNGLLHHAIRCADITAVRRLLDLGASPQIPVRELGISIYATDDGEHKHYFVPSPEDVFDILKALQSAGFNLNVPLDATGHTLLTEAAYGSLDLVRFLLARGCDVNRAGPGNKTPVANAVEFGPFKIVDELLKAGAGLQAADDDGNTPLHAAVGRGEERMVRLLLEKGANPDATSHQGTTPLMIAGSAVLVHLLHEAGANVDTSTHDGQTALMLAVRRAQLDVVRSLLDCGADAEAVTDVGKTAIHFAASIYDAKLRFGCLEALLQAGADVNEETNEGETPLMVAAAAGAEDAVTLMIQAGANVNAADRLGNTPLLLALQSGKVEIAAVVALLLRAGASVAHVNAAGETSLTLAARPGIADQVREMIEKQAVGRSPR